jgi:hypothetical protein
MTEFAIENLERIADGIARLSRAGLGQEFSAGTTATEVQGVLAGQQAGMLEYSSNFAIELERMADFGRWLLAENWEAFSNFHGDAIAVTDPTELRARCTIEVNGKTPSNTPQILLQKLQMMMQMAAQLGIQPIPPTKQIDTNAMFEAGVNAMELNISMEKIIVDGPEPIQPQTDPNSGGQPGIPQGPNGAGQASDLAAILQGISGGGQSQVPGDQVGAGIA